MAIKLIDPFNSDGLVTMPKEPAVYDTSPGKWYGKTVTIGTQTWMAENLKVTHYKDGTPIPCYTFDDASWIADTVGACSAYIPNGNIVHGLDETGWELQHGLLYNWFAVDNAAGLAPDGWHIPTDAEWIVLYNYLNSSEEASMLAGQKYLWDDTATTLQDSSDFGTTGFNALPFGARQSDGSFGGGPDSTGCGDAAYFWTADEVNASQGAGYLVATSATVLWTAQPGKEAGYGVRCIKD